MLTRLRVKNFRLLRSITLDIAPSHPLVLIGPNSAGKSSMLQALVYLHEQIDRGAAMTSRGLADLFVTLGVEKSHSRPSVSDDNPYSEAQFKTLKYRPDFPDRFGSVEDARAFCRKFFAWYNDAHHHNGLALLTPADVHFGHVETRIAAREVTLHEAHARHPERFVRGLPRARRPPNKVWINAPKMSSDGTLDGSPFSAPEEPGGCGGTIPAQERGRQ